MKSKKPAPNPPRWMSKKRPVWMRLNNVNRTVILPAKAIVVSPSGEHCSLDCSYLNYEDELYSGPRAQCYLEGPEGLDIKVTLDGESWILEGWCSWHTKYDGWELRVVRSRLCLENEIKE